MDIKAIKYTSFCCISLVFLIFLEFNSCTAHYDPLLIMTSRQLIVFRSKISGVLLLMKIDKGASVIDFRFQANYVHKSFKVLNIFS